LLLFSIKINKEPLIKNVQKELILDKDIFGKVYSEFDRTKKYDILFLGSSHCYRSFNPAIFEEGGYSCYNIGSSSQAPLNSYAILEQTIHNCKHVIFEVYPVAGNLTGTEAYYSMACSGIPYSLLAPMALELNNLRCYNILSIKQFIDHTNGDKEYNIKSHYKGYVETNDSLKRTVNYEEIILKKTILDEQIKYVKKIANLCKENNVALTFVYAPIPKELKLTNESYFLKKINEVALSNHLNFIDSGRNHNLNSKDHFFDNDHMNNNGVKLFNKSLIKILLEQQRTN
jgi:hypothetical protein